MRYFVLIFVTILAGALVAVAREEYSCNMAALTEEELVEYQQLATTLHSSVLERKELRNGFAFQLPPDGLVGASKWIAYERKCCPFFEFDLEISKNSGPLWLRITGERGIKDFIRAEFDL